MASGPLLQGPARDALDRRADGLVRRIALAPRLSGVVMAGAGLLGLGAVAEASAALPQLVALPLQLATIALMAFGVWLVVRPPPKPEGIGVDTVTQLAILDAASLRGGRLSVADCARALQMPLPDAEQALDTLASHGYADLEIDDATAAVQYHFRGLSPTTAPAPSAPSVAASAAAPAAAPPRTFAPPTAPQVLQLQLAPIRLGHGGTRSRLVALGLSVFFGWSGLHRFYLGDHGIGIVFLITWGFAGFGWALDVLRLIFMTEIDFQQRYNSTYQLTVG